VTRKEILSYLDAEDRKAVFQLLKKHKISFRSVFLVVFYSIGPIQNKFQQGAVKSESEGDYGRRWRRSFQRMIERKREEYLQKFNALFVHVDPTKLDTVVAMVPMKKLQPKLRRLQERLKFAELFEAFNPIRMAEIEVMSYREEGGMTIPVIHFAETKVSGGSAQEIGWAEMLGIPVYLYGSEDNIGKYQSRHVILSITAIGKEVVRKRNTFHTAEDALNHVLHDLPRLRRSVILPPLGKLFIELWNERMKLKKKFSK